MILLLIVTAWAGLARSAVPPAQDAYPQALAQYEARHYVESIQLSEAAATADPTLWQAWQLDGNARSALGDTAGALVAYHRAMRINPDNPELKAYVEALESRTDGPSREALVGDPSGAPAKDPSTITPAARTLRKGHVLIGVLGGASFGAPRQLNASRQSFLDLGVAEVEANGYSKTITNDRVSDGAMWGGEILYAIKQGLAVGFRVGIQSQPTAKLSLASATSMSTGYSMQTSTKYSISDDYSASVIPVQVGGRYEYAVNTKLTLVGGLFLGYAFATLTESGNYEEDVGYQTVYGWTSYGGPHTWNETWSGSGFAGDALLGVELGLTDNLAVTLDLGYRLLNIASLTAETNNKVVTGDLVPLGYPKRTVVAIKAGDVYRGWRPNLFSAGDVLAPGWTTVSESFSAVLATIRVSYSF